MNNILKDICVSPLLPHSVTKEELNIFALSTPSHGSPCTPNISDINNENPPLTPNMSMLVSKLLLSEDPSQIGKLVELNPKAKSFIPSRDINFTLHSEETNNDEDSPLSIL